MKLTLIILTTIILLSCDQGLKKSDPVSDSPELSVEEKKWKNITKLRQHYKSLMSESKLSNIQIDKIVETHDKKRKMGELKSLTYPEKSSCGGALRGFFEEDQLVITEARYSGDAGYTNRVIYWNNNNIIKIELLEHFAEIDKYFEKYPLEAFEFDEGKLTYSDKFYIITLGAKHEVEVFLNKIKFHNEVDSNLVTDLMDCGIFMKAELETERRRKM